MEETLRYLQFKNSLTLAEATLIILGESPVEWPEVRLSIEAPKGFKDILDEMIDDAKNIECEGVESDEEEGKFFTQYFLMTDGPKRVDERTEAEWYSTKVSKFSIFKWAKRKNLDVSYFGDDYLSKLEADGDLKRKSYTNPTDEKSVTYPPELDLAIQAWQAVTSNMGKNKPKAQIRLWLDENTDLSNEAKERISIVANWDKTGGATRTS